MRLRRTYGLIFAGTNPDRVGGFRPKVDENSNLSWRTVQSGLRALSSPAVSVANLSRIRAHPHMPPMVPRIHSVFFGEIGKIGV